MPYILEKLDTNEAARRTASDRPPMGAGITDEAMLAKIAKAEIWASSFKDPGADWCEFKFYDADGIELCAKRIPGY